nr:hypothetical protein [Rhizobium sophorae]
MVYLIFTTSKPTPGRIGYCSRSTSFYFGKAAPEVSKAVLDEIGYKNIRGHRVYRNYECQGLLDWLSTTQSANLNRVVDDPFQFHQSAARYSVSDDKILD